MKVCTDASLFGAWAPYTLSEWLVDADNILDIGTGTGLLSLMIAQKTNGMIDAVEVDPAAASQAEENFRLSPWNERLNVINTDISHLKSSKKYDFIISNPPFYEDDLRSPDDHRNAAMHDTGLNLEQLIIAIDKHLTPDGFAALLLPFKRTGHFETAAIRKRLHIHEKTFVRQTPAHHFFRTMLLLSRDKPVEEKETEITIHDNQREYTDEFKKLMEDYYLKV